MVQVINMALSNPELPVMAGDDATELLLQELMATSDSDLPHSPASSFSRETNEANLFSFIYFFIVSSLTMNRVIRITKIMEKFVDSHFEQEISFPNSAICLTPEAENSTVPNNAQW